jgi:hypothetical protein
MAQVSVLLTGLLSALAIGLLNLPFTAAPAQAAILFDDDFDHGQPQIVNFSALANWTVTNGAVDAFQNGGFGLPCPSSGCLDMDGTSGTAGTIESVAIAFGAGNHVLSLNVAGNQRGGATDIMDVTVAGVLLGQIELASAAAYSVVTFNFTIAAPLSGTILLAHQSDGDLFGILLDRVTVETAAAIAEPASLPLAGLALAGLGLALRRRRNG